MCTSRSRRRRDVSPRSSHVATADPATLAIASVALGLASIAAMWLPARRATHTDPIIALKEE